MKPYQQRVLEEKAELFTKLNALRDFNSGDVFETLPKEEQRRLVKQHGIICEYIQILTERIDAFTP